MSNTFAQLAAALKPVVGGLVTDFGVTATVRPRVFVTNAADGDREETFIVDPSGVDLPVAIELLTVAAAAKIYGQGTTVTARIVFANVAGTLPGIVKGDAIRITSGGYTGMVWQAETDAQPDGIGSTCSVGVRGHPAQAAVP